MIIADVIKEIADIIAKRGNWDGVNYIGYVNNLDGSCEFGECTDVVAVYVNPIEKRPLAYVLSADDEQAVWVGLAELPDWVLDSIYEQIKKTYAPMK